LTFYKQHILQKHLGSFHSFKQEDWPLFTPVITCPPDRPLTQYGQGDGSKWLCKLDNEWTEGSTCIIYSLGSNGDFQFENAMLSATRCQVHTFDCTYDGHSLDQGARHHYHKWCIGVGAGQYRTWDNITNTLRHQRVDLLKMDIEGHEFAVLASFRSEDRLPVELSLEMHTNVKSYSGADSPETTAELALVFLHLANLGYAPYSQEGNVKVPHCCSEFTFMRVAR